MLSALDPNYLSSYNNSETGQSVVGWDADSNNMDMYFNTIRKCFKKGYVT